MPSNVNAKGRKTRGRFALLPHAVMRHPAVATLSHAQFRILVLMAGEYCGTNNGALGLTADQAERQGIGSPQTFYAALRELEHRGLIQRTYPASRVPPRPTMYAITWKPIDQTEYSAAVRLASFDFRKWQPEN